MENIAIISTGSISLLVLYKAIVIYIRIMKAYRSVIIEAFRDQFTATELLSYKEVLFEEATAKWYAQRAPDEVDREERYSIRLAQQFGHLVEEYRERFFTYVLFQSTTRNAAAHCESYLLHVYYTSQLNNLHDDKEIDRLELD